MIQFELAKKREAEAGNANHKNKEIVRKGTGITGIGVQNINPHLSGRLTLHMLQKMQKTREADDEEFDIGDDNEFVKVQKLLERKKQIEQEKEKL